MTQTLIRRLAQAFLAVAAMLIPATVGAQNCIKLLVPLPDGQDCLPGGSSPFDVMAAYFQALYPWVVGTAAGVAILWCLVAGAAMIFHAGNDSERGEAKKWFFNAVMGLLLIVFSGMILNFINPVFFQL